MAELEKSVRSIEMEGLVWGSSKLVAIGYGIKKLQITIVVGKSLLQELKLSTVPSHRRGRPRLTR